MGTDRLTSIMRMENFSNMTELVVLEIKLIIRISTKTTHDEEN